MTYKILEVYDTAAPEKWVRIAEAREGQKLAKKGEQVTLHWEHEGQKVQTVFNLNMFPAYLLV